MSNKPENSAWERGLALPAGLRYDVEFVDLRYSVPSKNAKRPNINILKGVTGSCKRARLTAIMGASGAGGNS